VSDLIDLIKAGKYEFDPEHWDSISEEAKDLVSHLLDVKTKTRYSVFDALKHPWIAYVPL
jgi:serine/threonine protein kinase